MRFTRLRRAIEDGTLIDTHGKLFQGSAEKIAEAQRKRKKPSSEDADCDGDDEESAPSRPRKKTSRSPDGSNEAEGCNMCIAREGESDFPEETHPETESVYTYAVERPPSIPIAEYTGHRQSPTGIIPNGVIGEAADERQGHALPAVARLTSVECKQGDTTLGPVKQSLAIRQPEDLSSV